MRAHRFIYSSLLASNMATRKYLLVCMKRSDYPSHKVYWRPNRAGYTDNIREAGFYEASEIPDCAGSRGDWIIEPVWAHRVTSYAGDV
jgi:hypothetical protein